MTDAARVYMHASTASLCRAGSKISDNDNRKDIKLVKELNNKQEYIIILKKSFNESDS